MRSGTCRRAFRQEFYRCLTARADAVFELADAVLCADGPVRSLPELSLVGEHRRGHGSVYAALDRGRIEVDRLRRALAAVPLPRAAARSPRRSRGRRDPAPRTAGVHGWWGPPCRDREAGLGLASTADGYPIQFSSNTTTEPSP
ncbi:transposase [Nocardia gipuzkoensis]